MHNIAQSQIFGLDMDHSSNLFKLTTIYLLKKYVIKDNQLKEQHYFFFLWTVCGLVYFFVNVPGVHPTHPVPWAFVIFMVCSC